MARVVIGCFTSVLKLKRLWSDEERGLFGKALLPPKQTPLANCELLMFSINKLVAYP